MWHALFLRLVWSFVFDLAVVTFVPSANGFSIPERNDDEGIPSSRPNSFSRRSLLIWPVGVGGAVIYGKLVGDAVSKLTRGDLVYPVGHEQRVESTIALALAQGIPPPARFLDGNKNQRPMRVLEVGIGSDWRVQRRGLYGLGLNQLAERNVTALEVIGFDLEIPTAEILRDAVQRVSTVAEKTRIHVDLNAVEGSITTKLDFPDGYFDCVLCCLALCSVEDQALALQEIKRVLRPNGGTFGYVEHVAVNEDEPYRFLEIQQQVLDPLQQILADNCHLHRYTDATIFKVFEVDGNNDAASAILQERFLVDEMWPVACQCCGVIKRNA
jgi:SAM-dependent methyltransferase